MIKKDYHTHSSFSPDAGSSMEAMVESAIAKGLEEIVFTEHFEFRDDGIPTKSFSDPEYIGKYASECLRLKEKYGKKITIGLGIEIGQSQFAVERVKEILSGFPFDFVLASYHKISNLDLMRYDYPNINRKALLRTYLEGLYDIARNSDYDSLAHLDLIKRYAARHSIRLECEQEEIIVKEILKAVIERGKAIEINTSGLRQEVKEQFPSETILSWYHDLGGRIVTVGSDAHSAKDISKGFEAAEALMEKHKFIFPSFRKREMV